jgi:hypothetical protein
VSPNTLLWIVDRELRKLLSILNLPAWEMKTRLKTSPWLKAKLWGGGRFALISLLEELDLFVSVMANCLLYRPYHSIDDEQRR